MSLPESMLLASAHEVGGDDPSGWRDAALLAAARTAWDGGDLAGVRALAEGYDRLLLRRPVRDGAAVVLEPVSRAERRHRGAFATPPALAAALARWAVPSDGEPPTVVDPACGSGALLRACLRRLLDLGVPPGAALPLLHGVDVDPVAVALCRAAVAADLVDAGERSHPDDLRGQLIVGDALVDGPEFGWVAAFPGVLDRPSAAADPVTGWRGGFGAVVANPPWERLKVTARDWAGAPPAGLRRTLSGAVQALRAAGRHPLTTAGELNAYLPFAETCWRLLAADGRAALLVPAGFATDRSSARLLQVLVTSGSLRRLHVLESAEPLFPQVSGQVGVSLVMLRGGPGAEVDPRPAEVAVGLAGPDDPPAGRAWPLDAATLRLVNPNTGGVPVFGSPADARLVTSVHRRHPVLRDRSGGDVADGTDRTGGDRAGVAGWQLRLVTPLHMTRDAPSFADRPGPGLLPLWEAKIAGLLDHRGGSARPRYWVPESVVRARFGGLCARGWLAGYRNVSTSSSERTLLPCALPVAGVGNSLPLLDAPRLPLLLAALASLPVDYLLRQRHAGANVNFFKLEQVPLPAPAAYDRPAPWQPGTGIAGWVLQRLADAVVWAPELAGLAAELSGLGAAVPDPAEPPDPARRAGALAELDAVHAVLLGFDREDLVHVLGTFPRLRGRELRDHGEYLTAARVLAAYDALTG